MKLNILFVLLFSTGAISGPLAVAVAAGVEQAKVVIATRDFYSDEGKEDVIDALDFLVSNRWKKRWGSEKHQELLKTILFSPTLQPALAEAHEKGRLKNFYKRIAKKQSGSLLSTAVNQNDQKLFVYLLNLKNHKGRYVANQAALDEALVSCFFDASGRPEREPLLGFARVLTNRGAQNLLNTISDWSKRVAPEDLAYFMADYQD